MQPDLDLVFANPERNVITAHRGLSGRRPENTLTAFLAAVHAGADIVEFDVRDTQDGVPVILHDSTLDRTTNGTGPLRQCPWATVRRLEASYWCGTHDAGQRLAAPAEPGTRIPSFEEALAALGDKTCMNIQVYVSSEAVLRRVCDMVRLAGLHASVFLMVADFAAASLVRRATASSSYRRGPRPAAAARRAGARYLQPGRNILTPALRDGSAGSAHAPVSSMPTRGRISRRGLGYGLQESSPIAPMWRYRSAANAAVGEPARAARAWARRISAHRRFRVRGGSPATKRGNGAGFTAPTSPWAGWSSGHGLSCRRSRRAGRGGRHN